MARYEAALDSNYLSFIKSGVFLALEKLRQLTLRNCVKKVHSAFTAKPDMIEEKPH